MQNFKLGQVFNALRDMPKQVVLEKSSVKNGVTQWVVRRAAGVNLQANDTRFVEEAR